MDEYITKGIAQKIIETAETKHDALMMIDGIPAVDVIPVRHGRWETDGMMMDDGEYLMTRCTACGETYEYGYNMPFCPNCGADMRKDGDYGKAD